MAGLDPAIHVVPLSTRIVMRKDVDARIKSGHDDYFGGAAKPNRDV
ncbi:MAG: hypothetical protein HY985_02380 [Magnetospirillum sp.]|nr:hypothetical protein [Magnetospirillum sp.]